MPWVKLDDHFPDHPKIVSAGPLAAWLYVAGLCYCNRLLTDGFIPRSQVERLSPHRVDQNIEDVPLNLARTLCELQLWSDADRKGVAGFAVHDYRKYQPSRKQIINERAQNAIRQGRFRSGISNGKRNAVTTDITNAVTNTVSNSPPVPVPVPVFEEKKDSASLNTDPPRSSPFVTGDSLKWFDKVYAVYPNKDRKDKASREWVELAPSLETCGAIFNDVQGRVKAGWKRFERRFIPQLATYIHDRMWQDDATGADPIYDEDPYANIPHAWTCRTCGEVHEGTADQHTRGACLKVHV